MAGVFLSFAGADREVAREVVTKLGAAEVDVWWDETGIGWGDGGEHRASLGLPGGPKLCVTNLCVMDFHPQSKAMRLKSLHPGVTVETVRQSTGFEVLLPETEIPTTARPGKEELRILREEVDPTSMRLREFSQ